MAQDGRRPSSLARTCKARARTGIGNRGAEEKMMAGTIATMIATRLAISAACSPLQLENQWASVPPAVPPPSRHALAHSTILGHQTNMRPRLSARETRPEFRPDG